MTAVTRREGEQQGQCLQAVCFYRFVSFRCARSFFSLSLVLGCRHNFLCVPLPAENAWARAAHFQQLTANQIASASSSSSAAAAALTGSKRRRAISGAAVESGTAMDVSDNEDDEHAAQANEAGADGGADTGKRRKRDDEGRDEDAGASSAIDRSRCSSSTGMRLDGEAGSATAAAPFAEANLGLPLPHPSDEFDLSCLVRVYQPSEASAGSGLGNRRSGASFEDTSAPCGAFDPPFRLGDMVEVVGILTGDPVMPRVGRLAGAGGAGMKQQEGVVGDEEEEDEEDFELFGRPQLALPSSLVPRLHAILYRPLAPTYPLLQPTIKAEANIALAAGPRSLSSSSSSSFAATEESAAPLARTVQPFSLAEPSNPALLGLKASAGTLPLPPASSSSSPAATGAHWLQFRDDEEGASAASDSDRYLAAAAVAIQHPSTLAAAIADCRKAAINATADACFDFLFCGVSPSSSVSPPPGLPPALAAIPESLRREVLGTTAIPAGSVSSSSSFPSSGVFLGAANMRAALLATFTSALGGDALAAEYLLLHLLSSVTMRQDTLSVVGKLALNLQGFPEPLSSAGTAAAPTSASAAGASVEDAAAAEKERTSPLALGSSLAARRLHSLLGQLTPRTALLPLTISKLNNRRFAPKKDADTDRILAGVLQLGAGTHVTVDATVLQTGKLKEQGVLNLRELQGVINDQALTLHFPFHTQKLSVGESAVARSHLFPPFSCSRWFASHLPVSFVVLSFPACRHPVSPAVVRPLPCEDRHRAALEQGGETASGRRGGGGKRGLGRVPAGLFRGKAPARPRLLGLRQVPFLHAVFRSEGCNHRRPCSDEEG